MERNLALLCCCGIIHLTAWGQTNRTPAHKFLHFLNHYQTDSLAAILADNFQLRRTFSNFTNDKQSFLSTYLPTVQNFNGQFNILKIRGSGSTEHFLVEDESDYLKYLHINYPTWQITISTNQAGQVEKMILDTTENYAAYVEQMKTNGNKFQSWLNLKYPRESNDSLNSKKGLLLKRLKEYSRK